MRFSGLILARCLAVVSLAAFGQFACAPGALAQTSVPSTQGAPMAPAIGLDEARAGLKTKAKRVPAPQGFTKDVPAGVEVVRYPAKPGPMLAWLLQPSAPAGGATDPAGLRPLVVYAHGGFALGPGDADDAAPFLKAGFSVLIPAVRGENGNPGHYELFLGEVDDLIAAGQFASALPGIDPQRVYLFGHSIGGGLANLVALSEEHPFRLVASVGGNYTIRDCADIARQWGRFDGRNAQECAARFPDPYLPRLPARLLAYVGEQDQYARFTGLKFRVIAGPKFDLRPVQGDHFASLAPAQADFIAQIQAQAKPSQPAPPAG